MNKRIKKKRKTEILLLEMKHMLIYLARRHCELEDKQHVIEDKIKGMDKQVKMNSRR